MVTELNKQIAKIALNAFGGKPEVLGIGSADNSQSIDLLICKDRPSKGLTSYSTIGLSEYPMFQEGVEFPAKLEIAGICDSYVDWFPEAIADAAFYIMKTGWLCCPGIVLQNIISAPNKSLSLKHLYFTSPFIWENKLSKVLIGSKNLLWLLAFPITDSEYKFLTENGDDAFENLLEEKDADIFNSERLSII